MAVQAPAKTGGKSSWSGGAGGHDLLDRGCRLLGDQAATTSPIKVKEPVLVVMDTRLPPAERNRKLLDDGLRPDSSRGGAGGRG